jgi:hypothetical protein
MAGRLRPAVFLDHRRQDSGRHIHKQEYGRQHGGLTNLVDMSAIVRPPPGFQMLGIVFNCLPETCIIFDALSVAFHSQITLETLNKKIITLFMTVYSKLVVDRRWGVGLIFIFQTRRSSILRNTRSFRMDRTGPMHTQGK